MQVTDTSIVRCAKCGGKLQVYETREQKINGLLTIMRRRRCDRHRDYRAFTIEMPKALAMEVLSDD